MSVERLPVAEITSTAIRVLCREIGAVNTARFLNQFTIGFGNYTDDRDQVVGDATVDELFAEVKQRRKRPRKSPRKRNDSA